MVKLGDTLKPLGDYPVAESKDVSIDINGTEKSIQQAYDDGDLSGGGSSIQIDVMPIPSSEYEDKIVQYIGESGTYKNGYFYKCQAVEGSSPTQYEWVEQEVQESKDSTPHWSGTRAEYEEVKDTLEVGTYISITDDYENEVIQWSVMPDANSDYLEKIVQYVGESGTYKHGYFYECIEDDGAYSWEEKTVSTDYPIKEVDTLPTGDNIENYIYGKRDSEYSLDIAGLSKAEIEATLIANGFTIASTPHSYSYEFLITYPTPIDVWHPTEKKWLTPNDYDYISFNKTNPPELAIVRTNAAGQKVTMYIGTYGDYTVFKYSDPTSYYIGNSSRKSTEQLVLHREIGSLTNSVEYTSTIPAFNPTDTKDGVVIVFSGEDTDGFLQGHHYRWSENFSATIKECRIKTNAEGSYLMTYINQDEELKVGTHLYTRNGSSYWCQTMVSAMTDEYITLYDVNTKQSTTYTYGYTIIEDSPSTVTISYDWVDIGGGGDGGSDYEEFVGTQDEWNALSQSQKDKYDGKIVNIVEDGKTSTQEVEELTNYLFTEQALSAFPDITQRFHVYKYGRLIQISCDNLQLNRTLLDSDYFKIAEGLPAPVYTINFTYPTYPDDTLGKSSIASGYIGTGGNVMLRHIGMISDSATYLQGFTVVYLTREV